MKLAKAYQPDKYESEIYALWEASGAFAPSGKGQPYSIIMPPPNANANLHVGHALENIKDVMVRYQRLRGRNTIYIPGADHAGFETWVVFEKALEAEGRSRFDFSREKLYQMTWDFVAQNRRNLELQLRALGASCDWSSLVFTLDKKVIKTVYQTFKKMWDDGLIYRGARIVNYCTHHQTAFADIEVVFEEDNSHLWQIAYPLVSGSGEVVVATTRPETMLGDVAIAVHPEDNRFGQLVGQSVKLPLTGRTIPIVADSAVELGFGTGAVKITPAHDSLDYEIGQRHQLPTISVIGQDGLMTDAVPEKYRALTVEAARQAVIHDLKKAGYWRQTTDFKHQVPHCYKCGSVIQPLLMSQWFINVKPLASRAKAAVLAQQINFTPSSKATELARYYDEMRDWNISRQIPWGIPIPAFQNLDDADDWIFDQRVDQPEIMVDGKVYRRDDDTFDTWFSSGQWPFITTDYLTNGRLANFYPSDLMETGIDLLRPWVARMIMLGLYATNQVPFKNVYFHGMVSDERGRKMSKSKGNVINPMDTVAEFGSDALRLGIILNRSAGQSQAFSLATVVAGRNFANKLWNVARFIEGRLDAAAQTAIGSGVTPEAESLAEHWILSRLETARHKIDGHLKHYRFSEAVDTLYHVIWDDLADWFIEASKVEARPVFLGQVLDISLRLAHPFAPFCTETIWTTLRPNAPLLISAKWPSRLNFDDIAAAQFERVRELVSEIRYVVAQLPAGQYNLLYIKDSLISDNADLIKSLAKLGGVRAVNQPKGLRLASTNREAWLEVDATTLYQHQTRLELRLVEVRQQIAKLEKRLANPDYGRQAPTHLVEQSRQQLADRTAELDKLVTELEVLK
jgi:valyl-tRNA synthetase